MGLIDVRNLCFDYPDKSALNDINFSIAQGSVTALVGPNGAGKTTLLRCLATLETPLSGTVTIDGIDAHDHPREIHSRIGYLSDFFGVYEDLTVRQSLTYMAWCHKVGTKDLAAKIENISAELDLTSYLDKKTATLSRGYKQRLGVGLSLVHDPKILMLDEPASGMDPEARIRFSELILMLRSRGMTLIVSSHILAELEDYCTDMLVLREGEIKSHVILKDHQSTAETTIQIHILGEKERFAPLIAAQTGIREMTASAHGFDCAFEGNEQAQGALLAALVQAGVPLHAFTPDQKTLKTAYMDLARTGAGEKK